MKSKHIFLYLSLILIFSLTACGGKKEEVRLEALEKNEALISQADPCRTEEEIRKTGIPMDDVPFDAQNNGEKDLESVTYLVQDENFILDLAGCEVESSLFQFINGKLSNITFNLTDSGSYEAVVAEMTRLYGESAAEEPMEGVIMNLWEFQADYPVQAAVIGHLADGEIASGNFQVSYLWFEAENQEEKIFDLAQLQTEEGIYQYKDIPFGSPYDEVAEKLHVDFEKMTTESMPAWEIYYSAEAIDFEGERAKFSLEFSEDQLKIVKISCELSGGEEQFEKLAGEMIEQYGAAEEVTVEDGKVYKWEKDGNVLNAILTEENGKAYGMFGVFTTE